MKIPANSVREYVQAVPEHQREAYIKLLETIRENLPKGFVEELNYGMPGYVVPHNLYPAGYHCNPKQSLPFMSLAAQKHFIGFYHMGLYAMPKLMEWFTTSYANHVPKKLDAGKGCFRFKKEAEVPYELIVQLVRKISVQDWIEIYENNLKRPNT